MLGDVLVSVNPIKDWALPCNVDHLIPAQAYSIIVSNYFSPVVVSVVDIMMVHAGGSDFIAYH